jgi:hopanoid-associated phosphorylase
LVATGFTREVRTVAGPGIVAVAGGGVADALEMALESAAARGVAGILSFGLCGGLADGLRIGDWIVAERITGAVDMPTDPSWCDSLAGALPNARIGGFFADGRMIDTIAEKRTLGDRHRALAVDMESHVAAGVAARHGLPFAVARIVSDEVDHLLPHAITVSMRADGRFDKAAMLRSLARAPRQAGDVARTLRQFAIGFAGLKKGATALGPQLAFPG